MCNKQLNLESNDNNNLGIKIDENEYVCLPCNDIADFIKDDKPKSTKKVEVKKQVEKKITVPSYQCFLCKKSFTGVECSCGFKNPLFIKRKKGKKKKK